MVNCLLAKAYVVHHHHQIEREMDSIIIRQQAVKALLNGDDIHLSELLEYYAFIAHETARYTFYTRNVVSIPLEDLDQQAFFYLITLLRKVQGSEHPGLAEINSNPGYDDCLGLRPYLITSIRGRLKNFITEGGLIRVKKNIFEEAVKQKYGEKEPPKMCSIFRVNEGNEYIEQDALAIEDHELIEESIEELQLTDLERKILYMRMMSYNLEEIGFLVNKDPATVCRKLKRIGVKWQSANF